jgi:hypothetical protein
METELIPPKQLEAQLKHCADIVLEALQNGETWKAQTDKAHASFLKLAKFEGLKKAPKLFSEEISKLQKDEKVTMGLPLLPATRSNVANLCAFSDSCANDCVAFSGNGSFESVLKTRQLKTELLAFSSVNFLTLLTEELFKAVSKHGAQNLAVRLNTYSDIRWERVAPWLFEIFAGVQFYDYTKHTPTSRPAETIPANYHLTYSVSERTTLRTLQNCKDIGRPLAVVVEIRSGKLPGKSFMREIPNTWGGMQTIDGDSSDARYLAPKNSVTILRRKHTMKPKHPMIQSAAKLERKLK